MHALKKKIIRIYIYIIVLFIIKYSYSLRYSNNFTSNIIPHWSLLNNKFINNSSFINKKNFTHSIIGKEYKSKEKHRNIVQNSVDKKLDKNNINFEITNKEINQNIKNNIGNKEINIKEFLKTIINENSKSITYTNSILVLLIFLI